MKNTMKKILSLVLAVVILVCMVPLGVSATETNGMYCSNCTKTVTDVKRTLILPTCTQKGLAKVLCCYCNNVLEYNDIELLEHIFEVTKPYVAPTCKQDGQYGEKQCITCKLTFYFDAYGNNVSAEYVASNPLNALGHIDENKDELCDRYRCLAYLETPEPEPEEPGTPDEPCTCKCHGNIIQRIIFKITNFFQKLLGKNKVCACGVKH